MVSYLEKHPGKSLNASVKGLFLEVMKFTGAADQSDDITVLSVQYNRSE